MRYDKDLGKIIISTEELVQIAMRRISVADDPDEADASALSDRLLSPLMLGKGVRSTLDFNLGEYGFSLCSQTDGSRYSHRPYVRVPPRKA